MKHFKLLGILLLAMVLTVACGSKTDDETDTVIETEANEGTGAEDTEKVTGLMHVISREEGSGTRGAFTEITGILEKNDTGEEVDNTSEEVTVVNSTEGVVSAVNSDENAIGYISLGSLNDEVKAVKIDGVEVSSENVNSEDYKIARPFLLAYREEELSEIGQDFLDFIMSTEGQAIVEEDGYVSLEATEEYQPKNLQGRIAVAGSTSVTPLMEKLVDAYKEFNPGFEADIQSNGSSAGIQAVQEGIAEIGMSSRALKAEEEEIVESSTIAMDGIAVIVNKNNPIEDLSLDHVRDIFVGEILDWEEIE